MQRSNHTEVPNDFLDKWLPKLKGSEIQVFLVICRQTRGWHKETDRISISQLEEKTGLSNRCLIDASKTLKEKGLIYSEIKNGIKSYEIAYEESSQVNDEPMKKVHRGCEDSSQFAYEESSHTKETITKETKQKKGDGKPSSSSGSKNIPTLYEVKAYFKDNGYSANVAEKAFNYYNASVEDNPRLQYWRDSKDNKVRNWKMKMRAVWFKPENEIEQNGKSPFRPNSIHL